MSRYKAIAEWAAAAWVFGALVGGVGVFWYTYSPAHIVVKRITGPVRIVREKILVYKNNIVAQKTILCGNRQILVTAKTQRARTPVNSRRQFNEHRIVLHLSSYTRFFSFRQHITALVGYGALAPMAGVPVAGVSVGLADRFARVGPVRFEGSVRSLGVRGVLVLVGAKVRL